MGRSILIGGLAVIGIYMSLVLGEAVSTTSAYLYLRNDVRVPATLLRMGVLSLTVLLVAFLAGRILVRRSAGSGRQSLAGVAVAFALIIGLLQIFVYDWSVLGPSLLKVVFATGGLMLAANHPPQ